MQIILLCSELNSVNKNNNLDISRDKSIVYKRVISVISYIVVEIRDTIIMK